MKSTKELEQAVRYGTPEDLEDETFSPPTPAEYLQTLLEDRALTVREAIRRCNLDRGYGYQLFNGTRIPSRDLILILALELRFTEEEVQRLLKLSGRPVLYARCRRDAAILYALFHDIGLEETDKMLEELGEAPLR